MDHKYLIAYTFTNDTPLGGHGSLCLKFDELINGNNLDKCKEEAEQYIAKNYKFKKVCVNSIQYFGECDG